MSTMGDDLAPQVDDAPDVVGQQGDLGDGVVGDDLHHMLGGDAEEQAAGVEEQVFFHQGFRDFLVSVGLGHFLLSQ